MSIHKICDTCYGWKRQKMYKYVVQIREVGSGKILFSNTTQHICNQCIQKVSLFEDFSDPEFEGSNEEVEDSEVFATPRTDFSGAVAVDFSES